MTSQKLKPKPAADVECVRSWLEVRSSHVKIMHKVHSSHVLCVCARALFELHAIKTMFILNIKHVNLMRRHCVNKRTCAILMILFTFHQSLKN